MLTFKSFLNEDKSIIAPIFSLPKYHEHQLDEHEEPISEYAKGSSWHLAMNAHNKPEKEHEELSEKLSKKYKVPEKDAKEIHKYTSGKYGKQSSTTARDLNNNLKKGAPLSEDQEKMHHAILKHAKPSGHEVHLYSGVKAKTDISKLAKSSPDKLLHSKNHISASHSAKIAYAFTSKSYGENSGHIIHVHVKPKDKILHASHISEHKTEHETIIPAGTKLKYSHTTTHVGVKRDFREGHKVIGEDEPIHVHHFTIHSQE